MRRSLLPSRLGIGLLGLLLTCGCQHMHKGCPTCGASTGGVAAAPRPSSSAPALVGQPTTPYHATQTAPVEAPVLHTVAKPSVVETPAATPTPESTASNSVDPGALPGMTTLGHEGLLPRRTFTDLTANPVSPTTRTTTGWSARSTTPSSRTPGCCVMPPSRRTTATAAV